MTDAFRRYVARAGEEHARLWRILAGVTVMTLVSVLLTVALVAWVYVTTLAEISELPSDGEYERRSEAFFASAAALAVLLACVATLWPATWIAVRLVHRRKLRTVLAVAGRPLFPDYARGLAAALLVILPVIPLAWAFDAGFEMTEAPVTTWFLWALPFVALIAAQSSAEELVFRGYLPQLLAYRFRSPAIWALLPSIAFVLLHWDETLAPLILAAMLVAVATFTALAFALTMRTGSLGAAMGVHLGFNISAFVLMSGYREGSEVALFRTTPFADLAGTVPEAAALVALELVSCLIIYRLLVDPRSPLRLGPDAPQPVDLAPAADPVPDAPG